MADIPDVIDMVRAALLAGGYDGLFSEFGECACTHDDLAPCGQICGDCQAGYKSPCDCGDHDWHIQAERQKPEEVSNGD